MNKPYTLNFEKLGIKANKDVSKQETLSLFNKGYMPKFVLDEVEKRGLS